MDTEFEFLPATVTPDGNVQLGDDSRLYVEFFAYPVLMTYKSKEAGRPIYETRDFVRIVQPGERDRLEREATEEDKLRFPRQWAAYQGKRAQVPDGTPVSVLYPHLPHVVETLRAQHVHTVEQLAHLSEEGMRRIGPGARELVERAKQFLQTVSSASHATKVLNELEAARERIAELEAERTRVLAELDEIKRALKERRGRRRATPRAEESGEEDQEIDDNGEWPRN